MPEVRILRRAETESTDRFGEVFPAMAVTYLTRATGPRTVFLPLKDATEDAIKEAIRVDLERATDPGGRETLEV